MATRIRQAVTFAASPEEIYAMLMDSRTHARLTGSAASISRRAGGKVSAYGGYATGVNLELVPNRKIVQTWRASDWPPGHQSTVTFLLKKAGKGTRLTFAQSGVPADQHASIKNGWIEFYWKPMKSFLKKPRRARG